MDKGDRFPRTSEGMTEQQVAAWFKACHENGVESMEWRMKSSLSSCAWEPNSCKYPGASPDTTVIYRIPGVYNAPEFVPDGLPFAVDTKGMNATEKLQWWGACKKAGVKEVQYLYKDKWVTSKSYPGAGCSTCFRYRVMSFINYPTPEQVDPFPLTTKGMTMGDTRAWWKRCEEEGVPSIEYWSKMNSKWKKSNNYPDGNVANLEFRRPPTAVLVSTAAIPAYPILGEQEPSTIETGEDNMPTFTIENRTFINGQDINSLSDDNILSHVAAAEAEAERLDNIKTKSSKVSKRIESLAKFCVDAIAIMDKRDDPCSTS